jgi:hypothetical protein
MNKSPKEFFSALPDQIKIIFLARLSNDLTIDGRGFGLDLTGEIQIAAFKGLNELQHQISQHIAHLADGSNTYSSEALWEILQGTAANHRLAPHLTESLVGLTARLSRQTYEPR